MQPIERGVRLQIVFIASFRSLLFSKNSRRPRPTVYARSVPAFRRFRIRSYALENEQIPIESFPLRPFRVSGRSRVGMRFGNIRVSQKLKMKFGRPALKK